MSGGKWQNELVSLRDDQSNIAKRIKLLEEVIALEHEYAGGVPVSTVASVSTATVTVESRATPSGEVVSASLPKPQRPSRTFLLRPGARRRSKGSKSKWPNLPVVLEAIGAQHASRSFYYKDLALIVHESGNYKSESEDFSNMVYQCLTKLVKRGIYERNPETGLFRYVGGRS